MSKEKEKKLNNNEIDIENENISGGCHGGCMPNGGSFPGRGLGHRHGPRKGPGRGKWVWIPDDQGMMPPPPPGLEQTDNPANEPNPTPANPPSPDLPSSSESSTTSQ